MVLMNSHFLHFTAHALFSIFDLGTLVGSFKIEYASLIYLNFSEF